MDRINAESLASIQFDLRWQHDGVAHIDGYFVNRVNFWRDYLPEALHQALIGSRVGDTVCLAHKDNTALPVYDPGRLMRLPSSRFDRAFRQDTTITPGYGRFYPQGLLKDMPGIFKDNLRPFRYGGEADNRFLADLNHPLAGRVVELTARVEKVFDKIDERGGSCVDWVGTISDGPGMQARMNGRPTDFFGESGPDGVLSRPDERPDTLFYETPRLVDHIDRQAGQTITGIYTRLIAEGSSVLDLMSSWNSHLPTAAAFSRVTGLGLNREELAANTRLSDHVVLDLNAEPALPFEDGAFNAVVCTVSIEYLTRPAAIFSEVARVLSPGGLFIATFSNRWFPPKAVDIWTDCHEFERLGLVTEYFLQSGKYDNITTLSARGRPRPADDRYYPEQPTADPVYAVYGYRN